MTVLEEVLVEALERLKLAHGKELLPHCTPLELTEPRRRIGHNIDLTSWTGKEESPFISIHLFITEQNFDAQHEREHEFVHLEQRPANVLI